MHSPFLGTVLTLLLWTPPGLDGCGVSARPAPTWPCPAHRPPAPAAVRASGTGAPPTSGRGRAQRGPALALGRRRGGRSRRRHGGHRCAGLQARVGSSTSADRASQTPTPTPAATATPLPVTDVYRQVAPSVVLITTSKGSLGSGRHRHRHRRGAHRPSRRITAAETSRSCSPTAPRRPRRSPPQTRRSTSPR